MAEVTFSNAAEADLADIDEFSVTQFGDHMGEAYMHGFDEAFDLLGDFPMAGRPVTGIGVGTRCLIHRSHRIFYRISGDHVLILRVLHHAQDAPRHLK